MISVILLKTSMSTLVLLGFFVIMCFANFGNEWYKQYRLDTYKYRVLGGAGILFFLATFCSGIIFAIWGV